MSRNASKKGLTNSDSTAVQHFSVFGPAPILVGEDAAVYDQLFRRIREALNPVDIVEEMFTTDVANLEWENLRWRRLSSNLMDACTLKVLENFLLRELDYALYRQQFADDLTEILEDNLAEEQADDIAQRLALDCAWNEPDAVDKVNKLLAGISRHMDNILDGAKARKAKQLAREYMRGKRAAVTSIDKLIAKAGMSIEALTARALAEQFDYIERFDRLATIAESRRNAMLREFSRHRAVFAEAPRRTVQEVDGEYSVIEQTSESARRDQ